VIAETQSRTRDKVILGALATTLLSAVAASAFTDLGEEVSGKWFWLAVIAGACSLAVWFDPIKDRLGPTTVVAVSFGLFGLGLILVVLGYIADNNRADVQWYKSGSRTEAPELAGHRLAIKTSWIRGDRLVVPIRVAAVNIGDKPLSDVRVELGYPEGYDVEPQPQQSIDPDRHLLIYTHDVKELDRDGPAVILPDTETDRLVLAVGGARLHMVLPGSQDYPADVLGTILLLGPSRHQILCDYAPAKMDIRVRIFSSGDQVAHSTLELDFPFEPTITSLEPEGPSTTPDRVARKVLRAAVKTRRWDWAGPSPQNTVQFRERSIGRARVFVVGVHGVYRRIIVDADSDGFRDYDLVAKPSGDFAMQRYTAKQRAPMTAWRPHDLNAQRIDFAAKRAEKCGSPSPRT
jgi:hypothetical protein